MKKQLTSFILIVTMILTMLTQFGLTVFAATAPDTSVGLDFTNGTTDWTGTGSYAGVSWVSSTNTLTLTNANIHGIDNADGSFGIVIPDGTTIVLNGSNTVTGGISTTGNNNSYGFYCTGNLTIQGTGSLVATGGSSTGGTSCGIYCTSVTISGGNVTATGGSTDSASASSRGIWATSAVVVSGGNVTATGGSAFTSIGMEAETVNLNGGILIARGGVAGNESKAFRNLADDISTINTSNSIGCLTGSPAANYAVYGDASTYKVNTTGLDFSSSPVDTGNLATDGYQWVQSSKTLSISNLVINTDQLSAINLPAGAILDVQGTNVIRSGDSTLVDDDTNYGINAAGDLTIQDSGSINIISGNLTGAYTNSYCVYAQGNINISNATVNAFAGTSNLRSYAIFTSPSYAGSVNISSGNVTAIGGTTGSFSVGIYAATYQNAITISGGNITAIGGTVNLDDSNTSSTGINCFKNLSITGGNITAIGGFAAYSASSGSLGISFPVNSNISGGNITLISNGHAFDSGLNLTNNESVILASTNIDGSAPVTYVYANYSTYKYVKFAIPTYTVTVNLKKDGSIWAGSGKTITLQKVSETPTATTETNGVFKANVSNGIWKILVNEVDTGRVVVINNGAASQDLNYYTVQFAVTHGGTAIGSTISATYNSSPITSGNVVLGGQQLVITAVGQGASNYTYTWSGAGTSGETTEALTISALSSSVNAACSLVGIGVPLVITTANLSDGTVGTAYNQSLSVSTIVPLSWRIVNGFLPAGLTINPRTGAITGIPTTTGVSTFTVQVLSSYGNDAKTYTITIESSSASVPDVPTNVMVTAGNGSASLTWTTPANDGGSPITDYLINVYSDGNSVKTVDTGSTTPSATVVDLTNGAPYTFTVNAENSVGYSTTSSATDVVIPTAPHESTHPSGTGSTSNSASTTTTTEPTITANIVDESNNSTVITSVNAAVVANLDGTDTVTVKPSDAILLKQPDDSITPFMDYSKVGYTAPANVPVTVNSDGTVEVSNLAKGGSYDIPVTYDMGNSQKITIGNIHISVDSVGNVNMTSNLIDPYGILTDSLSGNVISGAAVTLYYADTARNRTAGITPNTVVKLPVISGFKPNNNQNPQTTDNNGTYGFMVYPNTDYYIVVIKDGYDTYTSPTISVATELIKLSAELNPSITGVRRIAGGTRIDTAIELAKSEFTGKVNSIIFATADNYPDALTGSVLAYQQKAPILLVGDSQADQDKVLEYMKDYLVTNGKVFLLGGTGVVTENFAGQVKLAGYSNVIRLGGADRYETAAKIADYLNIDEGTTVVIASGENYPDALAVSSAAAVNQYPILLVTNNTISDLVKSELGKIKPSKVYIIGGQGAINDSVENQLAQLTSLNSDSVVRLGGTDRYSTSVAVASNFKLSGKSACIATGTNFPDALAGSIYAANYNAPIILVGNALTDEEKAYIQSSKLSGTTIFGGEGAVNNEIKNEVTGLLSK